MVKRVSLPQLLRRHLHLSPRGATEFMLVALALSTANPTLRSLGIGAAFALTGEFIRIWAAGYSGLAPGQGPFRWVRHPYSLGSALLFAGLALASRNVYVMLATILLLPLVYQPKIKRVEAALRRQLGPWQPRYEAVVPAFLPRLLPMSRGWLPHEANRVVFSVEYALLRGHHRELDAVLAMVLSAGALYALKVSTHAEHLHLWVVAAVALLAAARLVYYSVRS